MCTIEQYGVSCNMTEDQCKKQNCNGNGQCNWNTQTCQCNDGFILKQCNFTIDDCGQQLCSGNGKCLYNQETQQATCSCNVEFRGTNCTECAENFSKIGDYCYASSCIQPGTLSVCSNGGGQCKYVLNDNDTVQGSYQCQCDPSYGGQYCQQCAEGYTEYHQKCTTEKCITGTSVCYDRGYCLDDQCVCNDDYYGNKCENTCTCGNGKCVQGKCACDTGFEPVKISDDNTTCYSSGCINNSIICSGNIILCQDNACNCQYEGYNLNGEFCERKCSDYCVYGTCYTNNETQEVMCKCPEYIIGDKCDQYDCPDGQIPLQGTCTIQECVTDDLKICNDHGQCIKNQKMCSCNQNWYQDKCTQSQYDCNQERCQGRGFCNANGTCSCNNGMIAQNCTLCNSTEIMIDDQCVDKNCLSDQINQIICNNQGVCQTGVCICNESWTNVQCQETDDQCRKNNCNEAGTCIVKENQLICDCDLLNQGYQCEKCEVSEEVILVEDTFCTPVQCVYENTICSKQGECIEGVCSCNETYFGQQCEITAENCSQLLCNGHGECYNVYEQNEQVQQKQLDLRVRQYQQTFFVSQTQELACNCTQHYTQKDCSICPENHTLFLGQCVQNGWFDPNDTMICNNNGYIGYDAICVCDDKFIGKTCNLTKENCDEKLCNSNGLCDEKGYQCTCNKENYAGEYCQKCNSGYIGGGCINSTPIIVSVVVVLVIIIIIIVIVSILIWQKRTKMGQMKEIKKVGFGFSRNVLVEPTVELKV